jgi:hypothetical protein
VAHTFDRPLLRDGVAEEDEEEIEHQSPDHNDSASAVHPHSELGGEHSHVQRELAHLEGCQTPDVDQREREGNLHDYRQVVDHCRWSQLRPYLCTRLTHTSGTLQIRGQNPSQRQS